MPISRIDCIKEAVRREERSRIFRFRELRGFGNLAPAVALVLALTGGLFSAKAHAAVADRISGSIDSSQVVALKGSVHPLAQTQYDTGAVSGNTSIHGISIFFKPSAAQQSALNQLLQQQQTPGSPLYHQWLTPAQYASQFGLSSNDVSNIQGWLERQGFQIDSVSNSGNRITFSGNAAQVERTFQTQMHHYEINGVTHMANATPISVPAAISGMVAGVRNLTDFRPQPRIHAPVARYTATSNGANYITPYDFAIIYDVNAQYNAGYTGTGETIAVVGQSSILASDVATFRSLSGLPVNAPIMTLVPGTGTSEASSQDEIESDIDVEWSGAVAEGATINFVYVGSDQNDSVFNALEYAIDNDLAPVVTISYGSCEASMGSDDTIFQSWFTQANAQGQTVVAASGDNGAADCDVNPGNPGATVVDKDEATQGAAVDYPGSSPNVTSMGGTEFTEGSGTFWSSTNNSDGGSADNGYIPAEVWNDTSPTIGLDAGGGGKSILFAKPSWQTGTGVPSDGARDVPDLSLNADPNHDGYLICSTAADSTSCTSGFADSPKSNADLDVYGGTSFAAPTFAGLLTLINQQVAPKGQGNINPLIYAIANSSAGATAFHDVTTGSNAVPCEAGSTGCSAGDAAYTATSTGGEIGYAATTGYDLASGWGSVDEYELAQAFAGQVSGTTAPASGSFTLSATNVPVTAGGTGTSTITVTPSGGYTGTVAFTVTASSLTNACYVPTNATVTGTGAATGTITIYTSSANCSSATAKSFSSPASKIASPYASIVKRTTLGGAGGAALASVLLLGFSRKRKRFVSAVLGSVFLGVALLGFVSSGLGCGGSSSSSSSGSSGTSNSTSSTTAPAGTYTLAVTGTNSATGSPSGSTTFTLTIP